MTDTTVDEPTDEALELDDVLGAKAWANNSFLIEDIARLGYLDARQRVVDPCFGKGVFWKRWRPANLVTHDLDVDSERGDGVDARRLPHPMGYFDAEVLDLPYISEGGRETSTVEEFNGRYGLKDAPKTPDGVQQMIDDSVLEARRVLKTYKPATNRAPAQGILLVKTKNYISSGNLYISTFHTITHALAIGFTMLDWFTFVGKPGMQPKERTRLDGKPVKQEHARQNSSSMLVFTAPKKRAEQELLDFGATL